MDSQTLSQEITLLHADICSALAEPRRILILYALSDRPFTVNDLSAEIGISQPATSRHLKILRERGLVHAVRQGVNVEYSLIDPRLIEALDTLRTVLKASIAHRASLILAE